MRSGGKRSSIRYCYYDIPLAKETIYRAVEESEYSVPGKKSKTGEINKLEWVLSFQGV